MNCEQCRIGHYQPIAAPYMRWLDDQIMVIPNVPAYTCDVCGQMQYDADFLQKLQYLLDRLTSDLPASKSATRPSVLEESPGWQPSRGER